VDAITPPPPPPRVGDGRRRGPRVGREKWYVCARARDVDAFKRRLRLLDLARKKNPSREKPKQV
jgi:hypothetical protein